ncbi:glycoside hydrolase family 16 protein [Streptomyces sp. NPDC006235]|uniref:glycoside hydrolase family 16 protein n=1 Tax=Streptomyces sp. NPDC006235 TaxID=3156736 RepID=UPI0033BCB3FF
MIGFALPLRNMTALALAAAGLVCAGLAALPGRADAAQSVAVTQPVVGQALFDDFNYTDYTDPRITQRGWTLKSGQGGPGVPGATWRPQDITFATESGNSIMSLRSGSNGTASGTTQTEIYQQRKFHRGTYAARVQFSDAPAFGPDGDRMVQTFFTITPLNYPMDPDYGELDFEYLPNGGWGIPGSALLATSWETYQEDPWQSVAVTTQERASFAGWHDLVITVDTERINYYIDGRQFASHTEPYLPETSMGIRFNHWLIDLLGTNSKRSRAYDQRVDYVYHLKDQMLTPAQVQGVVNDYRARGVSFEDTV